MSGGLHSKLLYATGSSTLTISLHNPCTRDCLVYQLSSFVGRLHGSQGLSCRRLLFVPWVELGSRGMMAAEEASMRRRGPSPCSEGGPAAPQHARCLLAKPPRWLADSPSRLSILKRCS